MQCKEAHAYTHTLSLTHTSFYVFTFRQRWGHIHTQGRWARGFFGRLFFQFQFFLKWHKAHLFLILSPSFLFSISLLPAPPDPDPPASLSRSHIRGERHKIRIYSLLCPPTATHKSLTRDLGTRSGKGREGRGREGGGKGSEQTNATSTAESSFHTHNSSPYHVSDILRLDGVPHGRLSAEINGCEGQGKKTGTGGGDEQSNQGG